MLISQSFGIIYLYTVLKSQNKNPIISWMLFFGPNWAINMLYNEKETLYTPNKNNSIDT